LVEVNGDTIQRVFGDSAHPHSRGAICSKCSIAYNNTWINDEARLASPLRRTGAKGSGTFEAITWPEALDCIAERLRETIATSGAGTILHAHYQGAPNSSPPTRTAPGRLRLISPSHKMLLNSTYGNDARIRRRIGPPTIILNANDAAARGVRSGDQVDVVNLDARIRLYVEVADLTCEGVAVCYKSRWPSLDSTNTNVNALNCGIRADLGEGTAVNSLEVEVVRADERPDEGAILEGMTRMGASSSP
jgi:anaerobic selenocysteine-containing dehydrogenase